VSALLCYCTGLKHSAVQCLDVVSGPEQLRLLSHQSPGHVGSLLLVGVRVLHHSVFPDETFSTHIASKWFLPGMQAHVTSKVGLVVELFWTYFTLVRLIPGVFRHVLLIKDLHGKSLATLCALKWFFSIMETLIVLLQVTYSVEYFIAFIAPKFACVIFDVAVRAIASLGTGSHLIQPTLDGSKLVPGEHGAEAVLLHPRVRVRYVCEGVALGQVVLGLAHIIARAIQYRLVVGGVV